MVHLDLLGMWVVFLWSIWLIHGPLSYLVLALLLCVPLLWWLFTLWVLLWDLWTIYYKSIGLFTLWLDNLLFMILFLSLDHFMFGFTLWHPYDPWYTILSHSILWFYFYKIIWPFTLLFGPLQISLTLLWITLTL